MHSVGIRVALQICGAISAMVSMAFSMSLFIAVHTDTAHPVVSHPLEHAHANMTSQTSQCWRCAPNSVAGQGLQRPACPSAPEDSAKSKNNTELYTDTSALFLAHPPPQLSIHVYDLPGRWHKRLLESHPDCATYQWAAEVKIPALLAKHAFSQGSPEDADFHLVPFPAKCYFNYVADKSRAKMDEVFIEIIAFIRNQHPWWAKSGGRDHIFIFPSGIGASMFPAWRSHIPHSIFLVAEGDRTKDYVNTWKDIIMPGVSDSSLVKGNWKPLGKRKHLIFFRGKLHSKDTDPQGHEVKRPLELRQALARDLGKKAHGEILVTDAVTNSVSYAEEMRDSVFCLCPRGGTPWTRRVFDALLTGCIPVIISDDIEFPFEDFLPYDKFTIKLSEEQVVKKQQHVETTLRTIPQASLEHKLEQIRKVREVFLYDKGHALNGILWQLYRKKRRFTHSSTNFWT